MTRKLLFLLAVVSVVGLWSAAALACPEGYVPCGEEDQLCCPAP